MKPMHFQTIKQPKPPVASDHALPPHHHLPSFHLNFGKILARNPTIKNLELKDNWVQSGKYWQIETLN